MAELASNVSVLGDDPLLPHHLHGLHIDDHGPVLFLYGKLEGRPVEDSFTRARTSLQFGK